MAQKIATAGITPNVRKEWGMPSQVKMPGRSKTINQSKSVMCGSFSASEFLANERQMTITIPAKNKMPTGQNNSGAPGKLCRQLLSPAMLNIAKCKTRDFVNS